MHLSGPLWYFLHDVNPWAIPIGLVSILLAAGLCLPVAKWLHSSRFVVWMLLASIGVVAGYLLTSTVGPVVEHFCDLSDEALPQWSSLTTISEATLDVWIFVPMGIAAVLLRPRIVAAVAAVAVLAIPIGVEGLQYLAPRLGRTCQINDALTDMLGVVIGIVVGLVIRLALHLIRRMRQPSGEGETDQAGIGPAPTDQTHSVPAQRDHQ